MHCPLCFLESEPGCCDRAAAEAAAHALRNLERKELLTRLGIAYREQLIPCNLGPSRWVVEPEPESLFTFLAELPFSAVPETC